MKWHHRGGRWQLDQTGDTFRVFWVSANDPNGSQSGGTVYSRSVQKLIEKARPNWKIFNFSPSVNETSNPKKAHRLRQVTSVFRAFAGGHPAKVRFSTHASLRRRVLNAGTRLLPKFIVLDGPDVYSMAEPLINRGIPYLLIVHNLESVVFASSIKRMPRIARGILHVTREAERYQRFEKMVFDGAHSLIHISQDEMQLKSVHKPVLFVPPTFEIENSAFERPRGPLRVGFIGKLTWWPNKQGLEWFLNNVWNTANEDVELHLWGLGTEVYHAPEKRISGHGYAQRIESVWKNSDVMIVPVSEGGGVNIKLCEALANGKPVLATPTALRGLPDIQDPAVVICNSLADWQKNLRPERILVHSRRKPHQKTLSTFDVGRVQDSLANWLSAIDLETIMEPL